MKEKKHHRSGSFAGLFVGLIIVGVGVVWLLVQMGLLVAADVWLYWPSLIIAVGVVKLFARGDAPNRVLGLGMIGAGAAVQLHTLGWIHLQWRLVWPVLVIVGGLWIAWMSLFLRRRKPEQIRASELGDVVVFGGRQSRVIDKDYQGGEATAVFGGYEIDFTDADIEGDEAVFEARAIFGGVEIRVPDNWSVIVKGAPIMGAFEDKTRPPRIEPGAEPKRLIISGFAIFGGVEIKN